MKIGLMRALGAGLGPLPRPKCKYMKTTEKKPTLRPTLIWFIQRYFLISVWKSLLWINVLIVFFAHISNINWRNLLRFFFSFFCPFFLFYIWHLAPGHVGDWVHKTFYITARHERKIRRKTEMTKSFNFKLMHYICNYLNTFSYSLVMTTIYKMYS